MLKDVILNKDVLPFHIKVSFDEFQKNYIKAKKHKDKKSLNFVFYCLYEDFLNWANSFNNKDYYSNITIYTCLRLLKSDNKTPGDLNNKIKLLESYFDFFNITYLDVIQESFILHMNKKSYIPIKKYSKPKDLFYYIAKEIKMFIFSIFRKYINYQKKQNFISILDNYCCPKSYFDSFYDKNALKYIPVDIYRSLIYSLLTQKKYKNKNINNFQQERYLCQLIKILPYNN